MKRVILSLLVLITSSCQNNLKNPITISSKDDASETKVIFTRYHKSGNAYYGKAFVKNFTRNKVFLINRFIIKGSKQSYRTYFLDKNTTFVPAFLNDSCDPQKSCEMDIITTEIPVGTNFNELTVQMDVTIENALDPKTLREMK